MPRSEGQSRAGWQRTRPCSGRSRPPGGGTGWSGSFGTGGWGSRGTAVTPNIQTPLRPMMLAYRSMGKKCRLGSANFFFLLADPAIESRGGGEMCPCPVHLTALYSIIPAAFSPSSLVFPHEFLASLRVDPLTYLTPKRKSFSPNFLSKTR